MEPPCHLLVVDDNEMNRDILARRLARDGFESTIADGGQKALNLLASNSYDLVLLDVMMPDMNGEEVLAEIRRNHSPLELPVIMVTARRERGDIVEFLSKGANDYVTKPIEMEVLKARIAVHVSNTRAQKSLQSANTALVGVNSELEAFAYSVSHDLRAPLRAMDGFAKAVLQDYQDAVGDVGKDYLTRIRNAAERMGNLIDDLLTLSQVTRGDLVVRTQDLSSIAQKVSDNLQATEPNRKVNCQISEGVVGRGDARLIRIVYENLLANAWKFTAKTKEPRIEVGMSNEEGETSYFVRDNGAGFDMAVAQKLFQPFQRLHSERDFPGTGVGLATVRRVIHRHGGKTWAQGAKNQGAAFFFTLP